MGFVLAGVMVIGVVLGMFLVDPKAQETTSTPVLVIKLQADGSWEGYQEIDGELDPTPLDKSHWPSDSTDLPAELGGVNHLTQKMFVFNGYKKNPCYITFHDGLCNYITIEYPCP